MNSVQRSIFFSAIERYASLVLFFVSTAVLSRLLTPQEFGVYAVVGAVTTMVAVSSQEFGGANYLIQKASLSDGDVRTAFTITFGLSLVTGLLICLLGGLLGSLYGEERVKFGIVIAAISFVITPFSTTILALLRRDLQFGVIAAGTLAGNFGMVAVSIGLALMGYSYLSPIWGMVAGNVVQAAYLIARRDDLRIFRPSLAGYGDVIHFGLYSSGVAMINVLYNSAPQLFLARVLDFTAVGLYSRAIAVTQVFDRLVIQAISPVIMPAIMSQTRDGADLKRIYLNAITLLTALHWPFLLFVALLAEPIISVWLGPSWLAVAPLVRLLCIAYLSLFAACLTYPVLVAVGRVRDALVASLISLPPSLGVILVASFFGVKAVAASAMLTLPFQAAVAIYFVGRHLDLRLSDLFDAVRKSGIVALSCGAVVAAGSAAVNYGLLGPIVGVAVSGILAAVTWLATLIAVDHPLLPSLKTAASGVWAIISRSSAPVQVQTVRSDRDAY